LISGAQIRAARAFLRWSAEALAKRSRLGVATVRRAEAAEGEPPITLANADALRTVLEAAGVMFVDENGGGAGVRLKKKPLAVAEITEKIHALDEKIATIPVEGPPSPEIGMNRLKKALVQNERTKLKNRRAKIKKSEPK